MMQIFGWIVIRLIRPIWSYPIKFIYWILSEINIMVNAKVKETYKSNIASYNKISTIEELNAWFRTVYKYKLDGPFGILDHDNSKAEFFSSFGDCEDVAEYSYAKFKQMGYESHIVWFVGNNPPMTMHFDTIIKIADGKYIEFNYGKNIEGTSIEDCIKNLGEQWKDYAGTKYAVVW